MNAHVKRDKNSFIELIVTKLSLARDFKQKIQLNITQKRILNHVALKFYIRKRYRKLFLYTSVTGKNLSRINKHSIIKDFKMLIPEIEIDSTQGNYKGILLNATDNYETIIKFLKLISILSQPNDFYLKESNIYKSYFNYIQKSKIPIHLKLTKKIIQQLKDQDIINVLNSVKKFETKNNNNDYFGTDDFVTNILNNSE